MDLRDYLDVLRLRWRLVLACTLIAVIAAALASMLTTPVYKSTTRVFVNAADAQSNVGTAYTGSLYTQQIVKSLVDVVTSERVTQSIADELNLDLTPGQIAGKLSANNPLDTTIVEISATDPSPEVAQRLATSAASQFTKAAEEYTQPAGSGSSIVTVKPLQAANLPTSPVSPRTTVNLALGLLLGLAVGVGSAVLLETLDTRIKTVESLQKHFDHPILAAIGYDSEAAKKPLVTQIGPHSQRAESFRQLRTNLQFIDIDHRPRSLVVASAIPREGKSTTAANLAITVAQAGQPVILVEGDLRRPKIADYLGVEGNAGLTDVLIGRAALDDVLQPFGGTGHLQVLPSGPLPPNPAELVGSHAMAEVIRDLEQRAFVLIDVPPLLPVTDAAVLSTFAGGAILVVAANRVRREQLRAAEENLANVGGRLLGLVFTMAAQKGPDAQRYGYSYSYEQKGASQRTRLDATTSFVPPVLQRARPADSSANGSRIVQPLAPVADAPPAPESAPASEPTPQDDTAAAPPRPSSRDGAEPSAQPSTPVSAAPRPSALISPSGAVSPSMRTPSPSPSPAQPTASTMQALGLEVRQSTPVAPPKAAPSRLEQLLGSYGLDHLVDSVQPDPTAAAGEDAQDAVAAAAADPPVEWTPPTPRPAFDPLTAPLDELLRWDDDRQPDIADRSGRSSV